tara:strand:+ start:1305 stop:1544 length:240 start_codon:yes stop_codon:yes gene_type:complete
MLTLTMIPLAATDSENPPVPILLVQNDCGVKACGQQFDVHGCLWSESLALLVCIDADKSDRVRFACVASSLGRITIKNT